MKKFKDILTNYYHKKIKTLKERTPIRNHSFFSSKYDGNFFVELCDLSHVSDLVIIQKACYQGQAFWTAKHLTFEIASNRHALFYIVYEPTAHKPVAFIGSWFLGGQAHISNIATIPLFQEMGIASHLISLVKQNAINESIDTITLEVRQSNTQAINYYQHLGFEVVSLTPNYYTDNQENAINMAHSIKNLSV